MRFEVDDCKGLNYFLFPSHGTQPWRQEPPGPYGDAKSSQVDNLCLKRKRNLKKRSLAKRKKRKSLKRNAKKRSQSRATLYSRPISPFFMSG